MTRTGRHMRRALLALTLMLATGMSYAEAQVVWRMSTKQPADGPEGKVFQYFADQTAKHSGGKITLVDELTGPNYGMNQREEIQLEGKKDMRKRKIPSPNVADALACTFAYPVFEADVTTPAEMEAEAPTIAPDYNPYSDTIMNSLH